MGRAPRSPIVMTDGGCLSRRERCLDKHPPSAFSASYRGAGPGVAAWGVGWVGAGGLVVAEVLADYLRFACHACVEGVVGGCGQEVQVFAVDPGDALGLAGVVA